ncbi:histone-lysine N-methyltransferase SETMAR [Trichonephila clavipes]|nr:histone-lysine N-methyltransferase SETMAR [Trichonephila clavipes]
MMMLATYLTSVSRLLQTLFLAMVLTTKTRISSSAPARQIDAITGPLCIKRCIFDIKDAPHTGRPVVENVDKITEITEVDRPVNSRSIAQELKIDYKIVLSHLRKVGFKKKLHVWVPYQLTPKNMMD